MHHTVQQLIEQFALLPHPEGGYYKETYRSSETISKETLPDRFTGERQYSSAIYFLLEQGNFSAFHRIQSDECWHFYTGNTLWVHMISPEGQLSTIRLGNKTGTVYQYVVPAGYWFASETAPGGDFSFVGCTVAPAFDFTDFELANSDILSQQFPKHSVLIRRLCR
ncbi:MAG: cupin domain-containing protein [Bacteroidota bacterium]